MEPLGGIGILGVYILVTVSLVAMLAASDERLHPSRRRRASGKGSLAFEGRLPPPYLVAIPTPPVDRVVQTAEVRQMLEAKSYRRERRGEPPLDVDTELARLLDSKEDTAGLREVLRAEIRELVISRNERRVRRGKQPLDVETETERQISGFTSLAK